MKYTNIYKVFFGLLLVFIPWSITEAIYETPYPAQEIVSESVGFYQTKAIRQQIESL